MDLVSYLDLSKQQQSAIIKLNDHYARGKAKGSDHLDQVRSQILRVLTHRQVDKVLALQTSDRQKQLKEEARSLLLIGGRNDQEQSVLGFGGTTTKNQSSIKTKPGSEEKKRPPTSPPE
jgi:hypothetical protein